METFTAEVQNSLRLSCLLVNDGTKCLRKVFIDQLLKKYNQNDLGTILTFPNVKQIIDDHKDGKNKKPRIINPDQYKLLYPKKKVNVETFDLTLICVLCNILCNIKIEIKGHGDISIGADISRIRTFRNRLFAHMTKLCMTTSEFESQWKELMHILVRLGGDQKEMEKWKTEPLSPQDYEDYKRYISSLIENDTQSIQVLNDNILENQDSLRKIAENVDRFNAKLNHLESLHEKNNPEAKLSAIKQIMEELSAEHAQRLMIMNSGIQGQLEDLTSGINELKEMNSDIRSNQLQIKSFLQNKNDNVESESLHDIKCILKQSKESYKILLINKPTNVEDEDISKCSSALGCVPWDIIFDLDNRTRLDHGIHSKLTFSLSNVLGKDFIPCTYAETSKITEDYKERIAKGQCSLYILANGCEEMKIPPINENKLGKSATKISHLLDDVFEQIPTKKNILLAVLILGENGASYVNRLIQLVKEVAESNEEKFSLSNSNILTLYIHEDLAKIVENVNLWNYNQCGAPLRQLVHLFESIFSITGGKDYFFPGKKGPCCFHSREMAQLKGTVELYHKNVGEIVTEGLSDEEIEDKIQSIKVDFLKGREIIPEAYFLNNKYQIFVEREEMTALKEKIEEHLQSRKKWSSHDPLYLLVRHDASGGGTTSIRFVLYSLRNKYPCMIILKIRDSLFDILLKIKKASELPLLIVLDDTELSAKDAAYVHARLRNDFIKALVVHVQRGEKLSEIAEGSPPRIFIPSTVTQTDRAAFNKLYETSKKKKGLHKVFLFGLIAFCDEYRRLDMHIDTCIAECSFQQKRILQIITFIWKYCHMATKEQTIYFIEPELGKSSNIFSSLGYGSDLLVCSNDNNEEIRPAHNCIIEPVLQKLIGESKKYQLQKFIEDIMDVFKKDFPGKTESARILNGLFVQKQKDTRRRPIYWTKLISDLDEYCGKEYVCTILSELEAKCQKQHSPFLTPCQVLLARYLMHEMKDIERSLFTIRKVLKIETGQSARSSPVKDSANLITYGFLLKRSLQIRCEHELSQTNKESFFNDVRQTVEEAVWAFQEAQKLYTSKKYGMYNELSFIGESKVRVLLLQVCFDLLNDGDHEKFASYMKTTEDPFVRESESEALEAVQKLEILLMNQRILLDDPLLTMDTIKKIQFNCLKLHFDQSTSFKKVIANIPENVPYDIGSMVRRRLNKVYDVGKTKNDKIPWYDLHREELEYIIENIGKRIHSSKLLRCNYRDLLYAMIYIRQLKDLPKRCKKKLGKYNIEYAIQCAREWVAKYKDDIEGHFILGSLLLVYGLQLNQGISQIREGLECLDKCNELCDKYKIEHYRRKRFTIGLLGYGLGSLVPLSSMKENHELTSFQGRQITKTTVKVRNQDNIICRLDQNGDATIAHQQQLLRFNIVIAYDKLLAINPQIEENEG